MSRVPPLRGSRVGLDFAFDNASVDAPAQA
jgi:hypothetical protein